MCLVCDDLGRYTISTLAYLMKTITISQSEFADILRGVKGATPITISAFTEVKARKTNNPFSQVMKLARINGMTGANHEASINRQREREGSVPAFEGRERTWGTRTMPALVEKGDDLYLPIQLNPVIKRKETFFGRDDKGVMIQVRKEAVAPFLPTERSPALTQGVERPVEYRNYLLSNVVAATINKQYYRIRAT